MKGIVFGELQLHHTDVPPSEMHLPHQQDLGSAMGLVVNPSQTSPALHTATTA